MQIQSHFNRPYRYGCQKHKKTSQGYLLGTRHVKELLKTFKVFVEGFSSGYELSLSMIYSLLFTMKSITKGLPMWYPVDVKVHKTLVMIAISFTLWSCKLCILVPSIRFVSMLCIIGSDKRIARCKYPLDQIKITEVVIKKDIC